MLFAVLPCSSSPSQLHGHPVSCGTPLTHSVLFAVLPCSSSPSQLQSPRLVWYPSHSLCVVCSAALLPLTATVTPSRVVPLSLTLCCLQCCPPPPHSYSHPVSCGTPLTHSVLFAVLPSSPSQLHSHPVSCGTPLTHSVLFAVLPSSPSQLHGHPVSCGTPLTHSVLFAVLPCSSSPSQLHGHPVSCGTPPFSLGSECQFECDDGYELLDTDISLVTCVIKLPQTSTPQWDRAPTACRGQPISYFTGYKFIWNMHMECCDFIAVIIYTSIYY